MGNNPLMPGAFDVFTTIFTIVFIIIALLIVAAFVFIIYTSVRRYRAVKKTGADPLTVDAEVVAKLSQSDLLKPAAEARSLDERLAEVDGLHTRGIISDAEHAAARERILRDI